MKKSLLIIFILIFTMCISVSANLEALDSDYVKDGEFIIASFNSTKNFIAGGRNPGAIEDACFWLTDYDDDYNIKYVSFLGKIGSSSTYDYANTVSAKGATKDELLNLCTNDKEWQKEFNSLAASMEILTDDSIPTGISFSYDDLFSGGFFRDSFQSDVFPVDDIAPESFSYTALNNENYYTVIENNGVKYLIAQLEVFPQEETLNWFNKELEKHPDKRVIVFTHSFIDENGQMYTMWDWNVGISMDCTSRVRGLNLANIGKPRDGEKLWEYCFSKHDNILAVISNHDRYTSDIKTLTLTNENGVNMAAVVANPSNGLDANYGPLLLMTKISADNTELEFFYYSPYKGYLKDSMKTVKLEKLGELSEPVEIADLPTISTQYNGANTPYIFGYEGNAFRPNANMTRAEACTIFARLILGTQNIPAGYTTRFTDVKEGDWFYNAIAYLDETGFFYRNKNTTYKPNEPITRAEFVDLANAASSLAESNTSINFKDVPADHFYYSSIIAAAGAGLVNGYEDNTFRPDNTITRAEVVTVINRLLGLEVSEKTVSTKGNYNVFSDSKNHWGLHNIIMASNANVHGDYYFEASLDGVVETSSAFEISNKHFKITLSKKNGKVSEIINLATGENVINSSLSSDFIYLTASNGSKILATGIEKDGNRLKITFKNKEIVYLIVDVNDNFISFEIDSHLSNKSKSVTFASLNTTLDPSDDDNNYRIGAMGMAAHVNPVNYGFGNYKNTIAHAYSRFDAGTMGAKLGVVLSDKENYLEYMKEVALAIDKSVGIVNTNAGPWAREVDDNYGDYIIVNHIIPESIDDLVKMKEELGFDQVDIARGSKSFKQGDFSFPVVESGKVEDYYEQIGSKLDEAGIDTGIHTYAYYISFDSNEILSNPKWQKQLEVLPDSYTLRRDITKFRVNIPTVEDATDFDTIQSFFHKNTAYILIDEEIILVTQGTSSGFINSKRGQCGTEAAEHKEGAVIYHLSGYFNNFAPVVGSELFYHVADRIAEAYNKGGFDMIYFDAIDGLNRHVSQEDVWYYYQMFIHRVVSQCEKDPIVEDSANTGPQVWNVRARQGAWDTASRGIKHFIDNHVLYNLNLEKSGFVSTLGWIAFCPDLYPTGDMKNTIHKTLFCDDLDYLGVNAIVHNMSIVINGFDADIIEANPFYLANVQYYNNTYSKLRKSGYFSDEAKEKVIENGGEFKIIEKSPGEYAFLEMSYSKNNVGNAKNEPLNTFMANNPFGTQTPYIRIESRYSTEFSDPITLFKFDETKTLAEQHLNQAISVNMSENMALSFPVKGTGRDGDALLISVTSALSSGGESGGRIDYFVDLNFEGWRDVVLLDADNADYDIEKYKFDNIATTGTSYPTYRVAVDYTQIATITLRTTGTGNKASVGEIKAYKHTSAPVANPTISVGGQSIVFNTELCGGEYIEFDPTTKKAILYHSADQTTEEISYTGSLSIQGGSFSATYSADAQTTAPVRAKVVFGFSGKEITN